MVMRNMVGNASRVAESERSMKDSHGRQRYKKRGKKNQRGGIRHSCRHCLFNDSQWVYVRVQTKKQYQGGEIVAVKISGCTFDVYEVPSSRR